MNSQPTKTWTAYTGDVPFRLTAPAAWADRQRAYLSNYLPGRLGDDEKPSFQLTVYPDISNFIDAGATIPLLEQTLEPIPGVVMRETRWSSGARRFAVIGDDVEHQPGAYALRVHDQNIDLSVHPNARARHGYPLRVMREAMLRTYEDAGGTVFHAAGADLNGHGVMLCGPRAAGKTTLLTHLLRATGGALLSNDRLILDRAGRLIAVPLPVPVARGTLDGFAELNAAASTLSRPQRTASELSRTFGSEHKAIFTAREYATALGVSMSAGAWLRTVLVPRLTDTTEPVQLRWLSRPHARDVLRANCFTPHDEFWQQPWLVPRTTTDTELQRRATRLIDILGERTPCLEVRFGVRNPSTDLTPLLAELGRNSA